MPKNQGCDGSKGKSAFGNMKRMLKDRQKSIDDQINQAYDYPKQIQSDHAEDDAGNISTKRRRK